MSKKHFIALADALRTSRPECHWDPNKILQWRLDVHRIADFCQSQNPRFDRGLWFDYIDGTRGPSGGRIANPPLGVLNVIDA